MVQRFYTPQEVAEALKIDVNTVYLYIRAGKLPAAKIGNRYRVSEEDIERFLEYCRAKQQEQEE